MPSSPLSLGYNQAIDNKLLDIPGSGIFHNTKGFRDPSGGNSTVFNNFGKYRLLSFIQLCSNRGAESGSNIFRNPYSIHIFARASQCHHNLVIGYRNQRFIKSVAQHGIAHHLKIPQVI
jgi:hypothetical protein